MFTAYDVESNRSSSSAARGIRRVLGRRIKLIGSVVVASCVFILFTDFGRSHVMPISGMGGSGLKGSGLSGIWDGQDDSEQGGKEAAWGVPMPLDDGHHKQANNKGQLEASQQNHMYVLNEHGDHFLSRWKQTIAPMHPDLSVLPEPSSLFPEAKSSSFLTPPKLDPFPSSRLREIISDPPDQTSAHDGTANRVEMSEEAYSKKWKGPEEWNASKEKLGKVQWSGFSGGRDAWENAKQKKVREERREAVRRGFVWGWQKYKDYAWGHDEVKPVSKVPSDPFNNWGASIVDTLDTLLIMGFNDEYNLCRPHVNQLNFHWVDGRDWSQGYLSPEPIFKGDEDQREPAESWGVLRDRTVNIPVFETGIRYLGGLIGAYDLSGDDLMLERAVELAEMLKRAFNTESGLPAGRMDPGYESGYLYLGSIALAEVGSMTLELMRLSQITKDRQWFDLAQRVTDYIEEHVIPRAVIGNLIPMMFMPGGEAPLHGSLTWGGMADSYYEYLIKAYKLLGGNAVAQQYKRIYEESVEAAKEHLYVNITVVPERDILAIGKLESGRLIPEIEHLTCFAGGMLGLGAKLLDRPNDMVDAERFTQSCYWLSAATPTGLQPEVVEFYSPLSGSRDMYENVTMEGQVYHPGEKDEHRGGSGIGGGGGLDGGSIRGSGPVEFVERLKGSPPGSNKITGRGLNRPETIESIFYMYRLTGDRKWQEKGWKMFVSWSQAAKVDGGFSSIYDVTQKEYYHSDNMESFMFAETLKYHFLLQSEPDVISLDDYVLNTEAHTFLATPSPPSSRFWTPPPSTSAQDLGTRGQGTDAQKWQRLEWLHRARQPFQRHGAGGGGGRGLGGGGGDPGYKPQPPAEFFQREDIRKGA